MIVLDERRGRYFALPPDDTQAWAEVVGGPVRAAFAPEHEEFRRELVRRGWIDADGARRTCSRSGAAPVSSRTRRGALPLRAFLCLVEMMLRLRFQGFAGAYERARAVARRSCGPFDESVALERALAAFRRAENFVVSSRGLEDCLPRSLALFVFLRARGVAVTHRIGVKKHPFSAHAWVEDAAGVAVLDWDIRVRTYTPLATLA